LGSVSWLTWPTLRGLIRAVKDARTKTDKKDKKDKRDNRSQTSPAARLIEEQSRKHIHSPFEHSGTFCFSSASHVMSACMMIPLLTLIKCLDEDKPKNKRKESNKDEKKKKKKERKEEESRKKKEAKLEKKNKKDKKEEEMEMEMKSPRNKQGIFGIVGLKRDKTKDKLEKGGRPKKTGMRTLFLSSSVVFLLTKKLSAPVPLLHFRKIRR